MAQVVLGVGTSHTPMISTPPEFWGSHGELFDKRNRELISPRSGNVVTYDELLAETDGAYANEVTPEVFQAKHERLQRNVAALTKTLREVNPDAVVIFTDDQDEIFFEDN